MSSGNSNASMLNGHAQYAKGYVEETIGNVTGSKEWQDGGKSDTQAGIDEMKAANQQKTSEPTANGFGGRVEELAGKTVGCEGMETEGQKNVAAKIAFVEVPGQNFLFTSYQGTM